jgi:hypothetical protein
MQIEEELDRIHELGFNSIIDWNMCFSISYLSDDVPVILICSYEPCNNIKFTEVIESCIDIFYEWYNKHKEHIHDLNEVDLYDITLGNITKRVKRDLNLDKLL